MRIERPATSADAQGFVRPISIRRSVTSIDSNGRQYAAGWLRTLSATGDFVYSGCYSVRLLPGSDQPSVHVAFPLESGNVQVFLRPGVQADGSLVLASPPGPFGADGAYVVVRNGSSAHATTGWSWSLRRRNRERKYAP